MRDDLPSRLKRSARRQFGALSRSRQKHCFCAAKTFARLDCANNICAFCSLTRRESATNSGKSSRLCSSTRHFEQHSRENDFAFVFKIAKYVNNLGIRDRQSEEWWDVGVLRVWVLWNVDFSMVL